jgi:hypothetical protein
MERGIPGSNRICASIANYQTPGAIPIRRVRQRYLDVPIRQETASLGNGEVCLSDGDVGFAGR